MREDLGIAVPQDGLDAHSPLSEIGHPIIRKTAEAFGADPADDHHDGAIKSSRSIPLLEIGTSQWRGGVWVDQATAQPWLVAAGLAKGEHKDRDDFYEQVKRADKSGATGSWLPTDADRLQLRREVAAALMVQWELSLQAATLSALESVVGGGEAAITIPHPKPGEADIGTATLTIDLVREPDYDHDDLLLGVELSDRHKASNLGWTATLRLLTTINPVQTVWDLGGGIYSPTPHAGRIDERVADLRMLVAANELALPVPSGLAHYSHRRNLAEATVEGKGVRSLCGQYFVPMRDHETMPRCPVCEERFAALPRT